VRKQVLTGEKSAILDNAQARTAFFDRVEKDENFRKEFFGKDADSQSVRAAISERRSHVEARNAELRKAEEYRESAQQKAQEALSMGYDVMGSPYASAMLLRMSGWSPNNAMEGVERLQQMAKEYGVAGYGKDMPTHYLSGNKVKSEGDLTAGHLALINSDKFGNTIKSDFNRFLEAVPNAHKSVGAITPDALRNAGLGDMAQRRHDETEVAYGARMTALNGALQHYRTMYQAEAGDAQPGSMNVATFNKLANTASTNAWNDVKLSFSQMNDAPTLDEYQQTPGYKPGAGIPQQLGQERR